MRDHEVPTHVQAEDRVLLGYTFPQIVALTAVAALAYGIHRYAPVGPGAVRNVLAVLFALLGAVAVTVQVGGRRLPAVAADLLRFALGARRFEGTPTDLMRSEAPAPDDPSPGFLGHLAEKARRRLRRQRKSSERRNGRRSPGSRRPRALRRRRGRETTRDDTNRKRRRRKLWFGAAALALLLSAVTLPTAALAGNPADDQWRSGDIAFQPDAPVPGRRLYVEALAVSDGRAQVTVRAATPLDVTVRAMGGAAGRTSVFAREAFLTTGQAAAYDLPLDGDAPSLTFAWRDRVGQAGAVSLLGSQLPHPLPRAEGDVCDLAVTSLSWRPGTMEGALTSRCAASLEEVLAVDTITGHQSAQAMMALPATVTAVTGNIVARSGSATATVPFVPGGVTSFSLAVGRDMAGHPIAVTADLQATLRIPLPAVTVLTHHPARVEQVTETVQLYRPGDSDYDSQTVTVTHDDGTTSSATAEAYAYVPSTTVSRHVTVDVQHDEHVRAETTAQGDVTRSRPQHTELRSVLAGDAAYAPLHLPEAESTPAVGQQTALSAAEAQELFRLLEWLWPW